MRDRVEAEIMEIGTPSRGREIAGAIVLLAGAVLVGVLTVQGIPPYALLLTLGSAAVLAWLVDGTSRRYVGPGLVALAAGLGLTLGQELNIKSYEHTLVYGAFGLALMLISVVNPKAVRASGAFLLYTGVTVAVAAWIVSFNIGWELTAVLAVWGIYQIVRIAGSSSKPETVAGRASTRRQSSEDRPVSRTLSSR